MDRPPALAPRTALLLVLLACFAMPACSEQVPLAFLPIAPPLPAAELEPGPRLLDRPEHCPASMQRVADSQINVCMDRFPQPGWDSRPNAVRSFEDAEDHCRQLGLRLCTEREWELGCRGRAGGRYPYGDAYLPFRCITETPATRPSGSRLDCRSDFGIWDTSGNVAEWTAEGLVKGGGATAGAFESRCAARVNPETDELPPHTGVRCCLDAQPEEHTP